MDAKQTDKKHWDRFWTESSARGEIYSTDTRILDNLRAHLPIPGSRVLEVGAGTGRDSAVLAAGGAQAYALDYSEEALSLMADSSRLHRVCGDALTLPFPDGVFDLVFHQGLLEHFPDPRPVLRENYRVLKKGGLILVDVPQRFHYYTVLKHILIVLNLWFAGWEREFSCGELRKRLEEAGFEMVACYGENLYPPIWYRGLRKVALRFRLRLPMYPLARWMNRLRRGWRKVLPRSVFLNTCMVIGCIGKKVEG